jgi:MFS family permease
MTDLDLICAKPYKIGLIGFITFLSFSIGSIIITKITDKKGRKSVVLITGIASPICFLLLLIACKSIYMIYFIVFWYGFTYQTRNSVTFLLATEFISKD